MNFTSLLELIVAIVETSLVLLQAIKSSILENISTITSIKSQLALVQGNANIKFMDGSN